MYDSWHMTGEPWQVTHVMTGDTMCGGNIFSKCQLHLVVHTTHMIDVPIFMCFLCQIYHSCYKDSPFYVALNLTWKIMLSHTLHTGCVICQQLFFGCVFTVVTFSSYFFFHESSNFNHLDRESLQISVHQHCNHFVHPVVLLLHSSVMLYSFVRSSLDTTHVTLELRSLIWWPFSHFIWYICMFSLTTFIWFFAWIAILVIWLQNRLIRLCHSTFPTTLLME